jgi:hypothetical protein
VKSRPLSEAYRLRGFVPQAEVVGIYSDPKARVLRSVKTALGSRPIDHKVDETFRGPVFRPFLALTLLKELESRMEARRRRLEWNDIKRELIAPKGMEFGLNEKTYHLRIDLRGSAGRC